MIMSCTLPEENKISPWDQGWYMGLLSCGMMY